MQSMSDEGGKKDIKAVQVDKWSFALVKLRIKQNWETIMWHAFALILVGLGLVYWWN